MVGLGGGEQSDNDSSLVDSATVSRGSMTWGQQQAVQQDHLPTFGGGDAQGSSSASGSNVNNNKKMRDMMVIDEICNMIRYNCQEQEVVRLINQYQINEAKLSNMQWSQENQNPRLQEDADQIDSRSTVKLPKDIVVDLNMIGNEQLAPLHFACSIGNESMVHYLLFKKHVDPNVEGKSRWRPLEYACWNGHPRIVDMLLKDKRTDLNYNHPGRGSCLHLAAKGHHFQICQMLLMHNIDFTLENQNGLKAKDATESRKILDIIAWYESNMVNNTRDDRKPDVDEIDEIAENLEEEKEEEEPVDSSYTASPNFNEGLGSRHLSGELRDDKFMKE